MRVVALAGLVCLLSQSASAFTCEDVRYYVETYGSAATLAYAKKMGATAEQIRAGRACLRQVSRNEARPRRTREVFER